MNLLTVLLLYIVGALSAQHIPISKGSASLEIGINQRIRVYGTITTTTETTSIHWVETVINITKRLPLISTGADIAHGGASQLSRNTVLLFPNVTLKPTTHGNPLYLHLIFLAITRLAITSPPYLNLTASGGIYNGPTSRSAMPNPASNSKTRISSSTQVIYTGASYHLGFSFGNAIFSFFCVLFVFIRL